MSIYYYYYYLPSNWRSVGSEASLWEEINLGGEEKQNSNYLSQHLREENTSGWSLFSNGETEAMSYELQAKGYPVSQWWNLERSPEMGFPRIVIQDVQISWNLMRLPNKKVSYFLYPNFSLKALIQRKARGTSTDCRGYGNVQNFKNMRTSDDKLSEISFSSQSSLIESQSIDK